VKRFLLLAAIALGSACSEDPREPSGTYLGENQLFVWLDAGTVKRFQYSFTTQSPGSTSQNQIDYQADVPVENGAFSFDAVGHLVNGRFEDGNKKVVGNVAGAPFVGYLEGTRLKAPQFNVEGGQYNEPVAVEITAEEGASVRYTVDGSAPSDASTVYSGAVTFDTSVTLKAVAVKQGMYDSPVATLELQIALSEDLPVGSGAFVKLIDAPDVADHLGTLIPLANGGYAAVGVTGKHGLVLKLAPDFTVDWALRAGDKYSELQTALQTSGGYLLVAGKTGSDLWLTELALDGTVKSSKRVGTSGSVFLTPRMTPGGRYASGQVELASGSVPAVLKLTAASAVEWAMSYTAPVGADLYSIDSLTETSDGGLLLAAYARYGQSVDYPLVIKVASSGQVEWAAEYVIDSHCYPHAVLEGPDAYFVAGMDQSGGTGFSGGNVFILKISKTDGSLVWQRIYGGDEWELVSGLSLLDGDLLLAMALGTTHGLVARIDISDGTLLWAHDIGSPAADRFASAVTNAGDLIGLGSSYSLKSETMAAWLFRYPLATSTAHALGDFSLGGTASCGTAASAYTWRSATVGSTPIDKAAFHVTDVTVGDWSFRPVISSFLPK